MTLMDLRDIRGYFPLSGRVATAGQPSAEQLGRVAGAGYRVVINLAERQSVGALANEEAIVRGLGLEYVHIPVPWGAPSRDSLALFSAAMARHRHETLFIHCIANKRASVFVMLHRVLQQGWPLALARQDLWRVWQPEGVWQEFVERTLAR